MCVCVCVCWGEWVKKGERKREALLFSFWPWLRFQWACGVSWPCLDLVRVQRPVQTSYTPHLECRRTLYCWIISFVCSLTKLSPLFGFIPDVAPTLGAGCISCDSFYSWVTFQHDNCSPLWKCHPYFHSFQLLVLYFLCLEKKKDSLHDNFLKLHKMLL